MILRLEQYLARVAGGTGAIPESPETNTEAYLAILAGENRQAPEPITRLDMYLYNLVGGNYPIPTPNTRIEQYLAKACGLDIEVPTPITREEQLWYAIAQPSWQLTTLTGTLPLTFQSKGTPLTDYKLYGTSDGAGVETESGEPAGYKIPTLLQSKNLWNKEAGRGNSFYFYMNFVSGTYVSGQPEYNRIFFVPIEGGKEYEITLNDTYQNVYTVNSIDKPANGVTYKIDNVSTFINHGAVQKVIRSTNAKANWLAVHIDANNWENVDATIKEVQSFPIYIGDSKLMAEEYVDYVEQKVYKLKEVHKDTVTINGIEWDILGYDHDTVYKSDNTLAQHSVTIQTHDCVSVLQFDAREALFAFPEGLAAGAYHFTIGSQPWYAADVNKTIQFTLANAIPAGGQLVVSQAYNASFTTGNIASYANGSTTTAIETVKMNEGSAGTSLGDVTNAVVENTNSCQRALLGSNNWDKSALKQWANSDAPAGSVWQPQTKFDRPPSWATTTAGFLHGLDPEFVKTLGYVKKVTALNNVSDGGGTKETDEKVFLISRTEAYMGNEVAGGEGKPYAYYSEYSDLAAPGTGKDTNRIKYRADAAKYWWLRSPYVGGATSVRLVTPSGELHYNIATNASGVAPACCIILDDINTNPYLQSLFLKPTDPPVALPELSTYQGENTLSCSETLGEVSITGYIKEVSNG